MSSPLFARPDDEADFDVVLDLPPLPARMRERAILRSIGRADTPSPSWAREAARARVPLSAVVRAHRAVSAVGHEDAAVAERQLAHLVGAHAGARPAARPEPARGLPYDLAWIRPDTPADALVGAVGRGDRGAMLFFGPPGTGKTALAREIARARGLRVTTRTASELVSKWLGETEKNIRAAFEEAAAEGSMLVLDEVDSFLARRAEAQRSFEVSQVNEMLVQIESFAGWLVCTTNFLEGLDPAALRRFPIKVRFEPPDAPQRLALAKAAAATLDLAWPEDDAKLRDALGAAAGLTPGDVSAVVQQVQLVGGADDAAGLVTRMVREVAVRPGARARAVGFG